MLRPEKLGFFFVFNTVCFFLSFKKASFEQPFLQNICLLGSEHSGSQKKATKNEKSHYKAKNEQNFLLRVE